MSAPTKPYTGDSLGSDGKPYVDGPGPGLGYYSGTLWPNLRFSSKEEAQRAAEVANIAHADVYRQAQADIRKALGLKL